jgi:hypothetical protein
MFLFYLWLCLIFGIILLASFPYSEEIKVCWWAHYVVCVFVFSLLPHQLLNGWTNIYGTYIYIMAPESILAAYFLNPSHQSVSICVPPIVARQQLGKNITAATNRTVFGCGVFYEVHVKSKESRRLVPCRICHCLYGLGSAVPLPPLRWTSQHNIATLGIFRS